MIKFNVKLYLVHELSLWRLEQRFPERKYDFYLIKHFHTLISLATICPGSSDPFFIVTYYIKWVTTSWTDGR